MFDHQNVTLSSISTDSNSPPESQEGEFLDQYYNNTGQTLHMALDEMNHLKRLNTEAWKKVERLEYELDEAKVNQSNCDHQCLIF